MARIACPVSHACPCLLLADYPLHFRAVCGLLLRQLMLAMLVLARHGIILFLCSFVLFRAV